MNTEDTRNEEKFLGKITSVKFGIAGYQDAQLGLHLEFSLSSGYCVGWSLAWWDPCLINRSEYAKWTEEGRSQHHDKVMRKLSELLSQAKVTDVMQLVNKPVEVTIIDHTLKDWRILTEVL